jgi:hypothetical protein
VSASSASLPDSACCSQVCPEVGAGGDSSGRNMDTTLEELQPPTPEGPVQQVRPWVRGGLRGTNFADNKNEETHCPRGPDRTGAAGRGGRASELLSQPP